MGRKAVVDKDIYASVVVDQAHPSIDRHFDYIVPEELMGDYLVGKRVLVPFGISNKAIKAYVLKVSNYTQLPHNRLKSIIKVLDKEPVLSERAIPLIYWMKEKCHCMLIDAINAFVPPGIRKNTRPNRPKMVHLKILDGLDAYMEQVGKRSRYMADILDVLYKNDGDLPLNIISGDTGAPASSFNGLVKRGLIDIYEGQPDIANFSDMHGQKCELPELTVEQKEALDIIRNTIAKGKSNILLHGVTGSGKTEVYMRAVGDIVAKGKQAIILVPEISLTPQTISRFKMRFGNRVAVLHSRLSDGERAFEWKRILHGEVDMVVGVRSAVFAPFKNLGIIIIDEAHDDSYKSEGRPRYHAVDVAKERCNLEESVLVIGTATPSIEQYYDMTKGEYTLVEMKNRVDKRRMPPVEVVDMRDELIKGNRTMFSQALYISIKEVLDRREQAILLLNRRGYAQFVSCRSCGWVAKCKRCDVSLTYHADGRILKCHYCGRRYRYPYVCPNCGSHFIKQFGVGTQRLEEQLSKMFPDVRTVRMDMDTTSTKDAHEKILAAFRRGEYDILLGTQMIAKGLDFPNVTLVGVITADTSLNLPEYKSAEKTFQLVTQVAGRTGRGDRGGKVIVQSYEPNHYAIEYASHHDYEAFYKKEINLREQFLYPPFSNIIKILIIGDVEKDTIELSHRISEWLVKNIDNDIILKNGLISIGANPAPIDKIDNRYRWQVLIKIRPDAMFDGVYHCLVDRCIEEFGNKEQNVIIDFYPVSLL